MHARYQVMQSLMLLICCKQDDVGTKKAKVEEEADEEEASSETDDESESEEETDSDEDSDSSDEVTISIHCIKFPDCLIPSLAFLAHAPRLAKLSCKRIICYLAVLPVPC